MNKKGRVLCSSDWHGCGTVANQVLNWLQPDDTLYFLGDCQDRGDDGLEILDKLMNRPNTYYILGNHDDMMRDAIPKLIKDINELGYPEGWGYTLWLQNGGRHTINKYDTITIDKWWKMKKFLDKCSTELRYTSPAGHTIIMEHAGYTPFDIPHRSHDPLWDRDHFYDRWVGPENFYLVHGHTPVQYLRLMYGYDGMEPLVTNEMKHREDWFEHKDNYDPHIIRYCSEHKFDLDMCTIVSQKIALLDLDTFEEIYFNEKGITD